MTLTVARHFTVKLNDLPEQWELFTVDPEQRKRSAFAAATINTALENAVNGGKDRSAVWSEVTGVMQQFRNCGAMDTEPRNHLREILDEIFGEETA